jgi:hypothetical protein
VTMSLLNWRLNCRNSCQWMIVRDL